MVAAVTVFGATLVLVDAYEDPDTPAVAVRMTNGDTRVGFLVSQNRHEVFVGTAKHCTRDKNLVLKPGRALAGSGRLEGIARGAIADMRIESAKTLAAAMAHADELLNDVLRKAGLPTRPLKSPCEREGVLDGRLRVSRELDRTTGRALAIRFRPIVRFDRGEPWRPLDIDRLVTEQVAGKPLHRVCRAPGDCDPLSDASQLADASYIDFDGDFLRGREHVVPTLDECPPPQPPRLNDCDGGPTSAIYYRAVEANHRVYVDYWWFLRYNDFPRMQLAQLCANRAVHAVSKRVCPDHEGDWEGVTVVTREDDQERLEFVDIAAHESVIRYSLDQLALLSGTRPVINLAQGSHAGYPRTCPPKCSQVNSSLPDGSRDGQSSWARNSEQGCGPGAACLKEFPHGSWSAFKGRWGARECVSLFQSCRLAAAPQTPAQQQRFLTPWCYVTPGDRRLRCDAA